MNIIEAMKKTGAAASTTPPKSLFVKEHEGNLTWFTKKDGIKLGQVGWSWMNELDWEPYA